MDISVNKNIEKVSLKDIFASLKDIFIGNNSNVDDNKLNREVEEIRKIESELGASTSIQILEKQIEEHFSEEKPKRRNSTKISSKKMEIKEENIEKEIDERDR